eukprot:6025094-Lingulodinium_polyedra.AAC.1
MRMTGATAAVQRRGPSRPLVFWLFLPVRPLWRCATLKVCNAQFMSNEWNQRLMAIVGSMGARVSPVQIGIAWENDSPHLM